MTKINMNLPLFSGFYHGEENFYEDKIEQDIFSLREKYEGIEVDEYCYDYDSWVKEYLDLACDTIEDIINEKGIEFKILNHTLILPKEYNFNTDKINVDCEVNLNDVLKLFIDEKDIIEYDVEENYKSRSGFISFMSTDYYEWVRRIVNEEELYIQEAIKLIISVNEEYFNCLYNEYINVMDEKSLQININYTEEYDKYLTAYISKN